MPERIDQERAELMSRRAQDDAFCRALIREMMLGSERVTEYPACKVNAASVSVAASAEG
jgi:hypothetical protein